MPRYLCDYCDAYLTHDSATGRRQHGTGWKHRENFKQYYMTFYPQWLAEQQAKQFHQMQQMQAMYQQQMMSGGLPPPPMGFDNNSIGFPPPNFQQGQFPPPPNFQHGQGFQPPMQPPNFQQQQQLQQQQQMQHQQQMQNQQQSNSDQMQQQGY